MRNSTQHVAKLFVGVAAVMCMASACASAPPPPSHFMTLGGVTAAPPGFIELCAHHPAVCGLDATATGGSQDSAIALNAPSAGAYNAAFWRSALAVDAPAATSSSQQRAAQPARYDFRPAARLGRDRAQALAGAGLASGNGQGDAEAYALPFAPALWKQIVDVNRKVNGAIHERSDLSATGIVDQWNLPMVDGSLAGDCEDYALEKRRLLMEAGLPASALSLAIVRTNWGQSHAVLLVTTDRGEYVLDSLTPWISAWTDLDYRWIQRQAPGSSMRWVGISKS